MRRRIAFTILLTVWAAIVVAAVPAWLSARRMLLAELDDSINADAALRLGLSRSGTPGAPGNDWYVARNASGRTVMSGPLARANLPKLPVISAGFVDTPDGRIRELLLKVPTPDRRSPSEIRVQASAAAFDTACSRLAAALALCGGGSGVLAAFAAAKLARIALRPLQQTADLIGSIDESQLDRRIDSDALPVELRQMSDRLNEMLGRLGQAFEQRRRFLADASHELRTPVAAMITTMEVALRRPRPAAELADTMQTCLSEARHLRQLVQALLRQVRADGSTPEAAQEMDAGQMLRECAGLAGSLAAEKSVRVVGNVDGVFPVRAEPARLRSVLLNLMSNAIEYNHPGGKVEVSARADTSETEIVVSDNGPGIAPEHLPHLFQPFYRGTTSREQDGHLGLGLFLVNSHVKAMGGECRVESALGSGTTFRVRIPSWGAEPVRGGA